MGDMQMDETEMESESDIETSGNEIPEDPPIQALTEASAE